MRQRKKMNIENPKFKIGDVVIIDENAKNEYCVPKVLIEITAQNYSYNCGWKIDFCGFKTPDTQFKPVNVLDILNQVKIEKDLFDSRQNHLRALIEKLSRKLENQNND